MLFLKKLKELSRSYKYLISVAFDFLYSFIVSIFALFLVTDSIENSSLIHNQYWLIVLALSIIIIFVFVFNKLYKIIIRHIDIKFIFIISCYLTLAVIFWFLIIYLFNLNYPIAAIIITWSFLVIGISSSRLLAKWFFSEGFNKTINKKSVVIFGAGGSGRQLLEILKKNFSYRVVAFIDDDISLQGNQISGINVYDRKHLTQIIQNQSIDEIFLAIAKLSFSERKQILKWLESFHIKVKVLPPMSEILKGKINLSHIRSVQIEDILGRDEVISNKKLLKKCINNQIVMVTGSGGSIGSELVNQIMNQNPKMIIMYELSEYALYKIEQKLKDKANSLNIKFVTLLGSVLDEKRLDKVFKKFHPNTVYHAAAYKHVPLVEQNIKEGFGNNTLGTFKLAKIVADNEVKYFVLISTDKAVRPTNYMGASKRLAELTLQALQSQYPKTIFSIVRFGNVLDSSGSVVPLFKKQIKNGGPVTVTHPEITRYFMTISEAVSLVIQAGAMAEGGEVFVLDMGKPVKIDDLAKKMIRLSGYQVAKEQDQEGIGIEYIGLRPGEKLYEELLLGTNISETKHPRIFKAKEDYLNYQDLMIELEKLEKNINNADYDSLNKQLNTIVYGFKHGPKIYDSLIA